MQTDLIISSVYGILIAAEVTLLAITLFQRATRSSKQGLVITLIPVIIATALQLLPTDWAIGERFTRDLAIWLALIGVAFAFGGLVLHDVSNDAPLKQVQRAWFGISSLWAIGFLAVALMFEPAFSGWSQWLDLTPTIPALVGTVGGIACGLFLIGAVFTFFYIASMPEIANRAAFWIVTTGIIFASIALIASGTLVLMLSGTIALYGAMITTAYGLRYYRLLDIRDTILALARNVSVIAMAWSLIFGTLYFLTSSVVAGQFENLNSGTGTIALAIIALAIAIIIVPARHIISIFYQQIMMRTRPSLASATAQYSQRVARSATLEEVVNATTETVNRVMGVRRSALILINNTVRVKDSVELVVLEMGSSLEAPSAIGYLHEDSPIYRVVADQKTPIGQYDLEYAPIFDTVADAEKQFFRELKMSAYVPVSADNSVIGMLATGPKINDTPYYREDIELLAVIGQQVGTALRSARLIDDLQHLNDSMRVLNKRLESAKIELEKLDSIKTDFITIASHELRTPLAQIRGYTDILDSLNQANALQEGQANTLVGNLRKSTERMEELISAMLDVSQIDVNSMDLRFIRTSPETIVKMALEPLRDPAEERKIEIVRHSAKDLPNIEADLQRMVQAIRNIVLNAIKFTPDGGRIEISAALEPATNPHGVDNILFKIQDTGVGIAKKDIEYIFNKFYRAFDTQLHSTGIYKFMGAGPGLGLTIAKGIIEGHGGQIWAESAGHDMNNPPGSTFYVRLPVEPPSGKRRVLSFEDDMNRTQLPVGASG